MSDVVDQLAHREILFGGSVHAFGWIIYILAVIALGVLAYAFYRRIKLWQVGVKDDSFSNLGQKTSAFIETGLIDGVLHRRILRDLYPGLIHALFFFGALLLLLTTALDVISHYFYEFLHGNTYLTFSFLADLGGLMLLIAVIMAVIRRYVQKPDRLDNIPADAIGLALIFIIVFSGYVLEGLRILVTDAPAEWAQWSFLGFGFAKIFEGGSGLMGWYEGMWWLHSLLIVGTILYMALAVPKLTHIAVSPLNVFFRSSRPKGALRTIDLEEAETFGAADIQDLTFKDLLDLDSCTRCGRCQDNCPAYLSGKALSPKKLIQDLKGLMTERASVLLSKTAAADEEDANDAEDNGRQMIGDVITEEVIWDCTTCRSCQEQCPVFIEPINKIIEMRRNLVLEQSQFPDTAMVALRSLEQRGHPWRGTMATRTDWAEGLDVTEMSENSDVDVLFWVGCTGALEERNMKVVAAVAKVLKAAGVNFGILGTEEVCCGDPARRIGNEYLFQMLVQQNIEMFNNYGVKKIVTACPHCFNTLKNEYPQFEGNFEVWHHTEFILDLLEQGKLSLPRSLDRKITYHDSCYLGRYNDVYKAPREIIHRVTGVDPVEMEHQNYKGFCCGAGGGKMWIEEQTGTRMNQMRTEEALKTNAEVLASACPFCIQMFEDAIKAVGAEEKLKARDIAEIIVAVI
ncbi:MAG: (Fe-S)-binding protein [Chloroflexota bacterium]|nr:(Fe-S)-binding protein [Chloroflexota bacterium]